MSRLARTTALAQGGSYIGFAAWALLRRRHYVERHDLRGTSPWVLNAHAGWMLMVGVLLARAGVRDRVTADVRAIGLASSAGLALNDAALARRLPTIYRSDLVWESCIALAWSSVRN